MSMNMGMGMGMGMGGGMGMGMGMGLGMGMGMGMGMGGGMGGGMNMGMGMGMGMGGGMGMGMNKMNFGGGLMNGEMNGFSSNQFGEEFSTLMPTMNGGNFGIQPPTPQSSESKQGDKANNINDKPQNDLLADIEEDILSDLSDSSIEQEPKQQRAPYEQFSEAYQKMNQVLDSWFNEAQTTFSRDPTQKQPGIAELIQKYLAQSSKMTKERTMDYFRNSAKVNKIENQKKKPGPVYTLYYTRNLPRISIESTELGYRKYRVHLGPQQFNISAVVLNLHLNDLRALPQKKGSEEQSVKAVLQNLYQKQGFRMKIQAIECTQIQHLWQIITNAVMQKVQLLSYVQNSSETDIEGEFGFDLVIFRDYAMYCYSGFQEDKEEKGDKEDKSQKGEKSEKSFKVEKLEKQENQEKPARKKRVEMPGQNKMMKEFLRMLKNVLVFKKILEKQDYSNIEKYLSDNKNEQYLATLETALKKHLTHSQPPEQLALQSLLTQSLPEVQKASQLQQLINKAFQLEDDLHEATQMIESLNVEKLEIKYTEKYLKLVLSLLKNKHARNGFFGRFVMMASKGKQSEDQESVFMQVRKIMYNFIDQTTSIDLLEELLCYFSAIGDQLTCLQLQQKLLSQSKSSPLSILHHLHFFLSHKIFTLSFSSFLHNSYIKQLQKFPIEQHLKTQKKQLFSILQKQKEICLGLMREISEAVIKKQYEGLKESVYYRKYCEFVGQYGEILEKEASGVFGVGVGAYKDVMVLLEHIYEKDLLKFSVSDEEGLAYKVMLEEQRGQNKLIRNKYFRLILLKDQYFHILYNTKGHELRKLKQVLQTLAPLYRYNGVLWLGLSECASTLAVTEGILKSSYIKLLNKSEISHSIDLIILLQIILKINTQIYEHQKFKFQLMMKCTDKFFHSLKLYHDEDSKGEVGALVKITSELMYCCARDRIFGLERMRDMVCEGVKARFQGVLNIYAGERETVAEDEKMLYLYARIMHITLLLCEEKKKQAKEKEKDKNKEGEIPAGEKPKKKLVISHENKKKAVPIIKDLIKKFPDKMCLLYYFLKVKYFVSLQEKKPVKDLILDNFWKFIKEPNVKIIKIMVNNQFVLDQIQQILLGSLKVTAINFINDFSRTIHQLSGQLPPSQIQTYILRLYQHFLNKRETPEEQTHCSYRRITEILLDRTENVTFDTDLLHQRVAKMEVVSRNPFLGYALFQAIESKKVMLPELKDCPNVLAIANRALGSYRGDEIVNYFRVTLYAMVGKYYADKLKEETNAVEIKKLTRLISRIGKKQCFGGGKHKIWIDQLSEILQKSEKEEMEQFRQIEELDEKERKELKKKGMHVNPKSSRHITRAFRKLRLRYTSILDWVADKKAEKVQKI